MSENIPFDIEQIDNAAIRAALGSIVMTKDVSLFDAVRTDMGHVQVWIDDPRGHYPLRRQYLSELCMDIGSTMQRVYFKDAPYDKHHPGRQFTLRQDNLHAITRILSPEDIE